MHRLSLLLVALALSCFGFYLIASDPAPGAYLLRDGLIIAAAGAILFAFQARPFSNEVEAEKAPWRNWLFLAAITAIAAWARFWQLTSLPAGCLDMECQRVLQVAAGGTTLFAWVAQTLFRRNGDALLSLRLASALLGTLTIPALYVAARRWTQPAAGLLAATLLALLPWHLWASRMGEPVITLPLLLYLLLWALSVVAFVNDALPRLIYWVALLTLILSAMLLVNELRGLSGLVGPAEGQAGFVGWWQQSGLSTPGPLEAPFLNALVAALALAGLGLVVRNGLQNRLFFLLFTITFFVVLALWVLSASVSLAILVASSLLLAALALDQIFAQLETTWRVLVRPAYLLGASLLLVMILGGRATAHFFAGLDTLANAGLTPAQAAISHDLAQTLAETRDDAVTFFVPAAVIANPNAHLWAGDALSTGRLVALERSLDTLAAGPPTGDLRFLIPLDQPQWIDWLNRLFPGAAQENHADEKSGEPLFMALTITPEEWAARQGLVSTVVRNDNTQTRLPAGPLQFDSPVAPPFTAYWQGTLLVPQTGDYDFRVEGADPTTGVFTLHLDEQSVLDSGGNIVEQRLRLIRGLYHFAMVWGATSPAGSPSLTLRWQKPGADWETIPPSALLQGSLPLAGLVATAFAGSHWEGAPLDQWRDLTLTPPANLTPPYSLLWQGKLATPRAGDYLFHGTSDGLIQLRIDGQAILNPQPPADKEAAQNTGESYLSQGWHDLEIRYAPTTDAPHLQLEWQPAGGTPAQLGGEMLAPLLPGADTSQLALPPRPPLSDPRLGNDNFALTQSTEQWQPQVRIPPTGLPPLPFALRWQAGEGCGTDERLLNQPHGVAIDLPHSQILVADSANRRIARFTLEGTLTGSLRDDRVQEPFDLDIALDGTPLLLDSEAQQIFRLNQDTDTLQPLSTTVSFYHPRGLGVDPADNLLVADTGGARVAIVPADGSSGTQFGGPGSPLGQGQPVDALFANGIPWAVTAEDGRLWRLDNGGSLLAFQPTNTLNGPHLAALPSGGFFLSDPARGLVLFYTASGQPWGQLAAPGNLVTPTGVASVVSAGNVDLAVVDSTTCTLSWWQAPESAFPR